MILRAFPLATLKVSVLSFATLCAAGKLTTGASLTAEIVILKESVSEAPSPSVVSTVRVTSPEKPTGGWYVIPARAVLRLSGVPWKAREASVVPSPVVKFSPVVPNRLSVPPVT